MRPIFKYLPLLFTFALFGCDENQFSDFFSSDSSDEEETCDDDTTSVDFKKVAYWTPDDNDNLEDVDFDALTHILYASISVNSDGSLEELDDDDEDTLEEMVAYAQDAGIKVGISLGDGEDNNFNSVAESTSSTSNFVDNVVDYIEKYDLDGVDINWQTIDDDDESGNFEELLEELQEEIEDDLSDDDIFISMAVSSGEDDDQADEVDSDLFDYVDFVNVNAFDSTDSDDLHSSLEDAEDAITYWTDRCLIQNKLVLGVPFYSQDDDEDVDETLSYDDIVDEDTDYACVDESEGRNYNGIPTIMDKTNYALLYAGGMMMMSLEQDSYDNSDYLLLDVINETADGDYVDTCD